MQKHPDLPQAFADLGVEAPLLRALKKVGYEEPSDIQRELIPRILAGHDIMGQARTGTGKTAAFGIPTLQKLDKTKRLQALCLAPTRELAVQVTGEIRRLAEFSGLRCVPIYGGQKIQKQVHQLGRKPHFVVGTPGRVIDMVNRGYLDLSEISMVILDEVDRMLDIGFRDDIRRILSFIKSDHQTIFVSATFDDEIRKLARTYAKDPQEVNVSRDQVTVEAVQQYFVTAERRDKDRLLDLILEHDDPEAVIVFTNTKHAARKLAQKLHKKGIEAMEIHGDLMQRKRDRVMDRFRKHRLKVLVATDLAARGIDVQNVTHIINYDLPEDIQIYVHRIGRTARMGAKGKAVSFVTREEGRLLTNIEIMINHQILETTYPGFKPSPPPEKKATTERLPTVTASAEDVAARLESFGSMEAEDAPRRRTMNAKTAPSRRRR